MEFMDLKIFTKNPDEVSETLREAAEMVEYQDQEVKRLRLKLAEEKDKLLSEALKNEYTALKTTKDYYYYRCQDAAFFFTPEERNDYGEFRKGHRYMDDDKEKTCLFQACSVEVIFHYKSDIYGTSIEVECPYCHTRRKLGTGHDVMVEDERDE